jgi:phytanoyl-CoA hydroxylase
MVNFLLNHINRIRSKFSRNDDTFDQRKIDVDFWKKNGYLALEGFFCHEKIDQINLLMNSLWQPDALRQRKTVVDIYIGTPNEQRIHLKNSPADAKKFPFKINDLYLEESLIRELILDKGLTQILGALIGGPPLVCNTLNFVRGSQQAPHTDSLYMTPPKDLNLIATWIALEDCHMDAGPLAYYPGSHLIPPFLFTNNKMTAINSEMNNYQNYMQKELEARAIAPKVFCAKKGDVFIWHCQLLHGGTPINNFDLTRKSLVTHYFKYGDLSCNAQKMIGGGYWMDRDPQFVPSK